MMKPMFESIGLQPPKETEIDFDRDVKPVLADNTIEVDGKRINAPRAGAWMELMSKIFNTVSDDSNPNVQLRENSGDKMFVRMMAGAINDLTEFMCKLKDMEQHMPMCQELRKSGFFEIQASNEPTLK